ncbi:MAG: hypothetical protein IPM39_19360 [Chloroflexi bacterium]|nr:hypothetical protein [Chloroflexota bacterium]
MDVSEQLLYQLKEQPKNANELLTAVPDFADHPHGLEVVRLLLRLDPRVQPLDDGRYTLTLAETTPADRIHSEAQSFLDQIPTPGALITSVVDHVAQQTHYPAEQVRAVLVQQFTVRHNMLFKPRQK